MREMIVAAVLFLMLPVTISEYGVSYRAEAAGCNPGWSSVPGPGFGQMVSEQAKKGGFGAVMQELMELQGCGSGSPKSH